MTHPHAPDSWYDDMATGHPEIDADHRRLLARLESFEGLVGHGAAKPELCALLRAFIDDARVHVEHEHTMMREQGFPGGEEHLAEDEKVLHLFEDVLLTLGRDDLEMSREAASFLRHVMVQHICKTDEPLRRFLREPGGEQPPRVMLAWSSLFAVGDARIDSEHKILIDYVNRLYELLDTPDNRAAVVSLLHSFIDHARRHFHSEGQLLQELAIPDRVEHMREHDQLLRHAAEWLGRIEEGTEALERRQVLDFVREWVVQHILFVDMRLKGYIEARRQAQG